MTKPLAALIIGIAIILCAIFALSVATAGTGTGQAAPTVSPTMHMNSGNPGGSASFSAAGGEATTIALGFDGSRYTPSEIRVKTGTKVRIEADVASLTGCMTTVNIDGYGIKKHITAGDNVIEFTADQPGTYAIHCNMGMGNGKFIVGDGTGDGTGSTPAETQSIDGMKMGCCKDM